MTKSLDKPLMPRPGAPMPMVNKKPCEFIQLTGESGNKVFVKASAVNGLIQKERITKVFLNNESIPYVVKETAEEVILLINGMDQ